MTKSNNLGRDLRAILSKIVEDVANQAHSVALDVELEGIGSMRQRIDEAETEWGKARQGGWASGPAGPSRPSAGRRETNEMYDKVIGWTDWDEPTRIEIHWGWEEPELYYLIQEHGSDAFNTVIEGMESLRHSLDASLPLLEQGLRKIKP